jgi:hypothetical protein
VILSHVEDFEQALREDRQGKNVVHELAIAVENGIEILPYAGFYNDLFKQPDISVQAILAIAVIFWSSRLPQSC